MRMTRFPGLPGSQDTVIAGFLVFRSFMTTTILMPSAGGTPGPGTITSVSNASATSPVAMDDKRQNDRLSQKPDLACLLARILDSIACQTRSEERRVGKECRSRWS